MSNYEMFKDLLLRVFQKEVFIELALFTLLFFLVSLIIEIFGGNKNSSKRKVDDEKNFPFRYPGGHELPM